MPACACTWPACLPVRVTAQPVDLGRFDSELQPRVVFCCIFSPLFHASQSDSTAAKTLSPGGALLGTQGRDCEHPVQQQKQGQGLRSGSRKRLLGTTAMCVAPLGCSSPWVPPVLIFVVHKFTAAAAVDVHASLWTSEAAASVRL